MSVLRLGGWSVPLMLAVAAPAAPAVGEGARATALADAAVDALKAKDNSRALDLSAQAVALLPNVNNLFIHGTACGNLQDWACAIADLERARSVATAGRADPETLNAIDRGLTKVYLFGGHEQAGLGLAAELKKRDQSSAADIDRALAAYFSNEAVAKVKAGDLGAAETLLERGARLAPSAAATLYVQAANVLAESAQPDWKTVEAEAQKALASDADDARANFVAGIAEANSGDKVGAIPFLRKAQANAGGDAELKGEADAALKKLGVQ